MSLTLAERIAQAREALEQAATCGVTLGLVTQERLRLVLDALDAETKRADAAEARVAALEAEVARLRARVATTWHPMSRDDADPLTEVRPPRSGEKLR